MEVFNFEDWKLIIQIMQKNEKVRIIPKRIDIDTKKIITRNLMNFGEKTNIGTFNPLTKYINELKNSFDLSEILYFVEGTDCLFTIDCMNSPISRFIKPILSGFFDYNLLNEKYSSDFNGKTPSPGTGKYG